MCDVDISICIKLYHLSMYIVPDTPILKKIPNTIYIFYDNRENAFYANFESLSISLP